MSDLAIKARANRIAALETKATRSRRPEIAGCGVNLPRWMVYPPAGMRP